MQSSAAFKAACLTASLATAWSAIDSTPAKADTVQVSLNLGSTALTDLYLGFKTTASKKLAGPYDFSGDGDYSVETGLNSADLLQYVAVGLKDTSTVVVSFASADTSYPYGRTFEEAFPGFNENALIADLLAHNDNDVKLFTDSALGISAVPQGIGSIATLVSFSSGAEYGSITVSLGATAVPLPSGLLMGGALLALVVSGKRGASWVRARCASNLPCV
jgi:hypothetical protein